MNFFMYNEITGVETKYESLLCNTKSRWSRKETGSPEEQRKDEEEFGEEEDKADEQIISENQHREVHDPIKNTLDFQKIHPTDRKNCPRLQLPDPRPP